MTPVLMILASALLLALLVCRLRSAARTGSARMTADSVSAASAGSITEVPCLRCVLDGQTGPGGIDGWYLFLWEHLGCRVAVTFERAGVEYHVDGRVACHADGSYQLDDVLFVPGQEGFPVRWALLGTSA
jgi:hypothetical protein